MQMQMRKMLLAHFWGKTELTSPGDQPRHCPWCISGRARHSQRDAAGEGRRSQVASTATEMNPSEGGEARLSHDIINFITTDPR